MLLDYQLTISNLQPIETHAHIYRIMIFQIYNLPCIIELGPIIAVRVGIASLVPYPRIEVRSKPFKIFLFFPINNIYAIFFIFVATMNLYNKI